MASLNSGYLFLEVQMRKRQFLAKNPHVSLISLGIGDTTEPLPLNITSAFIEISEKLGTPNGYIGYGPEQGINLLRQKIGETIYGSRIDPQEIFISDGAKCDIGRLQTLFGGEIAVAIQDPAYPVYIDGSIIQGVDRIHTMMCCPENQFFPDLRKLPPVDLIYFCSPNNPTGAVYTHAQLEKLVAFAKKHRSLIVFDTAYAAYIRDPGLPKSIFEINGAKDVAIEVGSFSKLAGFTGVRLGWTVIPETLRYEDGTSIKTDWNRITTTLFNGASVLAQYGGLAALENEGLAQIRRLTDFYLENACLMKEALMQRGYEVFGGDNAPYLWVRFPGQNSWDIFQKMLEKAHLITTPGSGFGEGGKEFLRLSAYGKRADILQAIERLKAL